MSFTFEAAPSVPPVGRHFDFAKHLRDARGLLVKRVLPNLRDASVLTYKKASAAGVLLASPFFWLEEHADSEFDGQVFPKAEKKVVRVKVRNEVGPLTKYLFRPSAALLFMSAIVAPSMVTDGNGKFIYSPVAESAAETPEADDMAYVRFNDPARIANGARLNREYWARRGERFAPVASSDVPAERRQIGPMQVNTGFFTEDEFGTQ